MGCPLCTRWGMILVISGLGALFLSNLYPFLMYISIGLIISAYIVPSLLPRLSQKYAACDADAKSDPTGACSVERTPTDVDQPGSILK